MFKKMLAFMMSITLLVGLFSSTGSVVFAQGSSETSTGNFSVLSYNVAGLKIPKPSESRFDLISPLLNDYDIVGVQENFAYDGQLTEDVTLPYRNIHLGEDGNGNGLNIFSNYRVHTTRSKTWFWRSHQGADKLTQKGFSFSEVEVEPGVLIHVYNLHGDAGQDDGSNVTRAKNLRELAEHVKLHSSNRAVIVTGDTNAYYFRGSDELEKSLKLAGLKDPMIELIRGGVYPTPLEDWKATQEAMSARDTILEEVIKDDYESVDKIFYKSGGGVTLEAIDYKIAFEKFSYINDSGVRTRMSDHSPTVVNFNYTIDRNKYPEPNKVYLSDIRCESATSGWGYFKADSSVAGDSHSDFDPIVIEKQRFSKGLGVHANSELVYNIDGKYKTFKTYIGIDDEVSGGSVKFQVKGDGRLLYQSPTIYHNTKAIPISVDVSGVNRLVLKVTDAGNGHSKDHADWADAKLLTADYVDEGFPVIFNNDHPDIIYSTGYNNGNISYHKMSDLDFNGDVTRIRESDSYPMSEENFPIVGWLSTVTDLDESFALLSDFYSKRNNPTIEFTFNGTGIDYVGQKDFYNDNEWFSQRPCSISRVYLDGEFYRDVHINTSTGELWPNHTFLEIRDLPQGEHTIKIERLTGEWMVLDAFKVYGSPETTITVNDNEGSFNSLDNLTLIGDGWRLSSNRGRGDLGNDVTEIQKKDAAFEFRFYGRGVAYIAPKDSSNGYQRAFIDGTPASGLSGGLFNTHANSYTPQQKFEFKNLPSGWHTLRIENVENTGSEWFRIDGFEIYK
ncbi:NPCBM/NEW2 domain-containing protein [Wukongibacter baidiensis]|uniref:NPCBM/NEW2 domain-containing protein n=1 Tax=Wukongibacter baidiensis TaxID=1723361 RepID=UPI003D7F5F9D